MQWYEVIKSDGRETDRELPSDAVANLDLWLSEHSCALNREDAERRAFALGLFIAVDCDAYRLECRSQAPVIRSVFRPPPCGNPRGFR